MKDLDVEGKIILKPIFESIRWGMSIHCTNLIYDENYVSYEHGSANSVSVQLAESCYINYLRKRYVTDLGMNRI